MSIFKNKQENIIIAGCGKFGSYLLKTMCLQDDNISIIDQNEKCLSVLENNSYYQYIKGDATDVQILEQAGIQSADVLLAATDNDNANIMIAQIAKQFYKVNTVIAVIKDIDKEFLCKEMNIMTISPLMLSINKLQLILTNEKK
ncbi:NAD-binding protein [Paludicola sp. MB14-C6]|uniref:potassium channel family protein n=1 Tax=Paludihabitans sp. MB14-C6 TaxID=3070656 RepID=UPI0027DABCF4|nr:NAD(P)-binding protein [Paludicola sp. MB14-C6]WMJ22993.1 NAD-binding protein [Paludicola sp. MB14-C6]